MPRRRIVQAYARYQSYERQTYCRLIYDDGHDCSDFFEAERLQELLPRLFEQHAPAHFGGLGSVQVTYDGVTARTLGFTPRGPVEVSPPSLLAELAKVLIENAAVLHAHEVAGIYYSERPGWQPRLLGLAEEPAVREALMRVVTAVSGDDMFELCLPSDHIVLFDTEPELTVRVRNVGRWTTLASPEAFPSQEIYDCLKVATVQLG